LYIPPLPDGITLCFDNHHSVKFCYINCYTKIVAAKNVAVMGFWIPNWRHQFFLFQYVIY